MIVISGAKALTTRGWLEADVAIEDAKITHVGVAPDGEHSRIDGTGMILGPAFVDLHTHLREPGESWKEDIETGTAAAARGGYAAVVAMPNTDPAIDRGEVVDRVVARASAVGQVAVALAGALTSGRAGEEMSRLDEMYDRGVRIFTDDGDSVGNAGLLRRIMTYLKDRGDVVVAQHAEDPALSAGGHLNEGMASQTLGVLGIPASAETSVIARDLELVADVGIHYHVQHLSTARGVELVRQAKQAGLPVTAEVTPHHLTLTDADIRELDTNLKMYPPLRTPSDRAALVAGLSDGTIDAIATDHAPHAESEKDVPFEEAPRGVTGLETAFPLGLAALSGDLDAVFERMSITPARISGLSRHGRPIEVGAPANLVLVDPLRKWKVGSFASRAANSPFAGWELEGEVMATIVEGKLVYGDGA